VCIVKCVSLKTFNGKFLCSIISADRRRKLWLEFWGTHAEGLVGAEEWGLPGKGYEEGARPFPEKNEIFV